jgi:hypothetical protein
MVKTNKDRLLEIAVVGEVVHSAVEPLYVTGWDGITSVGQGLGVTTILTCREGEAVPVVKRRANIADFWGLK